MLLLLAMAGCESQKQGDGAPSRGTVRIDGSSTVFVISEAAAEEYQKQSRGARVAVGVSGTGGGFAKLCAGETDVANASRPIKTTEVARCAKNGVEYVELPIAYDGIAIVVNQRNTWATGITTDELKKIWEPEAQAKITRWRQVRAEWPDEELHLFGAGVDSGTYDYFTEAINGKEHASRGDYTSSEDDNVLVTGVANDVGALGYFGLAYYKENQERLRALAVDDNDASNGAGPISPSIETVRNGTYQPLSRPVFIYVSLRALERKEVSDFATYYVAHAAKLSEEVGYVPLPARAYELAQGRLARRVTGSTFGGKGSEVGVTVERLLTEERE